MFTSDNGPAFTHRQDQVPDEYREMLKSNFISPDVNSPGYYTDELIHQKRFNCGYNGAKGSVYEGGIKVPMILKWPDGIPNVENSDQLVHFVDWLPTLLATTGSEIKPNLPIDGKNILPILRGETKKTDYAQFWQFSQYPPRVESNAGMRKGPWKLVRPKIDKFIDPVHIKNNKKYVQMDIDYNYKPDTVTEIMSEPWSESVLSGPIPQPELYNLDDDPGEQNNVAEDNPQIALKMENELRNWFQEVELDYITETKNSKQ